MVSSFILSNLRRLDVILQELLTGLAEKTRFKAPLRLLQLHCWGC